LEDEAQKKCYAERPSWYIITKSSDLKTVGVISGAISPQALPDLIGSIYDCALDPARWEQTLADVGDALECHILNLSVNDLRDHA